MDHKKFLYIVSQLLSKNRVSFTAFGLELTVEKSDQERVWSLAHILYSGEGEMPKCIRECVSPTGSYQWQKMGPHLSLDSDAQTLFLIEEIPAARDYLPFKELVHHFAQVALEWESVIYDIKQS